MTFEVITGGRDEIEREKTRLFSRPEEFEMERFEQLCDAFNLCLSEVESLIARRLRFRAKNTLERDAVLAIIQGDLEKSKRLQAIMRRRNSLGLKVLTA
jgi:hypothetical protein